MIEGIQSTVRRKEFGGARSYTFYTPGQTSPFTLQSHMSFVLCFTRFHHWIPNVPGMATVTIRLTSDLLTPASAQLVSDNSSVQ